MPIDQREKKYSRKINRTSCIKRSVKLPLPWYGI
jgi:hypothetical protein